MPVRFADSVAETLHTPDLGEHTDEILAQLGIGRGGA
jgi:hypothetical protein